MALQQDHLFVDWPGLGTDDQAKVKGTLVGVAPRNNSIFIVSHS
jgi:hypothetical protein